MHSCSIHSEEEHNYKFAPFTHKLGLMKQFVKGSNTEGNGFRCVQELFISLTCEVKG